MEEMKGSKFKNLVLLLSKLLTSCPGYRYFISQGLNLLTMINTSKINK